MKLSTSRGCYTVRLTISITRCLWQREAARFCQIGQQIGTFAEMNAVWDAWVPQGTTPARATVEAKLASPKLLVEIAVIAARG